MSGFQGSISATNPPAAAGSIPYFATGIISFLVGDGQLNVPVGGETSLHVATLPDLNGNPQSIVNANLLVIREGIQLPYSSVGNAGVIKRYNHAGNGGWTFEPASGQSFVVGERYNVFIVGTNFTDQV